VEKIERITKLKEANMLVLSRKSTESIHIGDNVVITVLEIRGNKVSIGIEAPRDIHVLRSELQDVVSKVPVGLVGAATASSQAEELRNCSS
jgi:carbon storage regulator CsrA